MMTFAIFFLLGALSYVTYEAYRIEHLRHHARSAAIEAQAELTLVKAEYRHRIDEVDYLVVQNEFLREALGEILWEYADLVGEGGKYGDEPDALDLAIEKGIRVMAGDAP